MGAGSYEDLKHHVGHKLKCVYYGDKNNPANVAIECLTCNTVLLDFDHPEMEEVGMTEGIKYKSVSLWRCDKCGRTDKATYAELAEIGTPFCGDCSNVMDFVEETQEIDSGAVFDAQKELEEMKLTGPTDTSECDIPRWIDSHSVNCYFCSNLFDERDGVPADKWNNNDGGTACPECAGQREKQEGGGLS